MTCAPSDRCILQYIHAATRFATPPVDPGRQGEQTGEPTFTTEARRTRRKKRSKRKIRMKI
jgi:hypothetical protein